MKYLYQYADFTINKIKYYKEYFSILIEDHKNNMKMWIDCFLTDGYGAYISDNFKKEKELFIEWGFNQYIFYLDDETDIKAEEYQENRNNIDNIDDIIMHFESDLINDFLKNRKEVE